MPTTSDDPTGIVLRFGVREDIAALTGVFYRAVREGAGPEYSAEQRAAWAPAPPEIEAWDKRLTPQKVFVAELAGTVIGFMTLRQDGYIDLAFVDPDHIGSSAMPSSRGLGAFTAMPAREPAPCLNDTAGRSRRNNSPCSAASP
jgi:hypothetical protein